MKVEEEHCGVNASAGSSWRKRLPVLLGWTISIVLILYLIRVAPIREIWIGLQRVDFMLVLVAMGLVGITLWLRGARWSLLFLSHHQVSAGEAAKVATVGLALNAVLPARIGEVARIALANRRFHVGMVFAAATVIVERLLDGATLLLFLGGALVALPAIVAPGSVDILGTEMSGAALGATFYGLAGVCLLFAGGTLVLSLSKPRQFTIRVVRLLPWALAHRIQGFIESLSDGMGGLRNARTIAFLATYSVTIWIIIALANMTVAYGMHGFHLSIGEALILTAVSVAASSIPSAPGAWGTFEAGGVLALQVMQPGLDISVAVAYMLTVHVCQYFPTVVLGACLVFRGRNW